MAYGLGGKTDMYDKYIDEFVVISWRNGNQYAGQVISIQEGAALLNPYVGKEYDDKEDPIVKLKKHKVPGLVPLVDAAILPTTERNIVCQCKDQTKQLNKNRE